MRRVILIGLLFLNPGLFFAQDFKHDNKYYQTITWNEFFVRLKENPKLVFFDVRTPGERADTSAYLSMNQGKIRGAIETDFYEFEKYFPEYLKHKSDTIYLYCSHSRRSRILAKRLADSSFAHVVSINGGLSYLNSLPGKTIPGKQKFMTTALNYDLISPFDFVKQVQSGKSQVIDVRPDSIYSGQTLSKWDKAFGKIPSARHIPFDRLEPELGKLNKSADIILFDNDGEFAPKVADYLNKRGYKACVLLHGLDNLLSYIPAKGRTFLKPRYRFLNPEDMLAQSGNKDIVLIDVRTPSEFNSTDTTDWKNVGRLKNAINIPLSAVTREQMEKYRGKQIILYDIMMHEELFDFADKMDEYGIDYSLLYGGIVIVKWEAYNTENTALRQLIYESE